MSFLCNVFSANYLVTHETLLEFLQWLFTIIVNKTCEIYGTHRTNIIIVNAVRILNDTAVFLCLERRLFSFIKLKD